MSAPLIEAEELGKKLCRDPRRSLAYAFSDLARDLVGAGRAGELRPGEFWAVEGVSFRLERGECLAILGANGAGKSTLLKLIHGRMSPDRGRVVVRGRLAAISDLGLGFDPRLSGRENARHAATLLGLGGRDGAQLLASILEFSGVGEVADAPVGTYSAGMRARLGFAVAAHLEPDVLLVDEALAVGDVSFRRRCLKHMARLAASGRSLAIVSHDLYSLQVLCPRALYLERGRVAFAGTTSDAVARYLEAQRSDGAPSPTEPGARGGREPAVEIESVTLRGLEGCEPRTGEPAEVIVGYRAVEAVEDVPWFFLVASADLMVEVAAGVGALETDGVRLEAGRGKLAARIPRLPLLAGTYGLRAAIVEPHGRAVLALHGYQETPPFVTVQPPADEVGRLIRLSRALIEVETERSGPGRRETGGAGVEDRRERPLQGIASGSAAGDVDRDVGLGAGGKYHQ